MVDEAVLGALAEARALGFLGPGPLEAHVASAKAFAEALEGLEDRALDLGSGGGVPGLLLAAHFTEVSWTLLDVHRRRTSFLSRVVAALGWVGRVDVVRAQAEAAAHNVAYRQAFAAVTARSFGPPAVTAEVGAGFLAPGGRLVIAEPPTTALDRWPAEPLLELGLALSTSPTPSMAILTPVRSPAPDVQIGRAHV